MTYPPQPGQGGQPDPYGQGWQQPPSGGVPQPHPGWDPNAQQQHHGWDPNAQQQQPQGWDPNAQQQQGWDPHQQQPAWDPNQPQPGWDPNAQPYGQPHPTQQYPQPGWDPNQQQYGQGYGGPGGPGGPGPQKNKTALWIGIAVAVVLVVALGITGFVAPGFFLSKDDTTTAAQSPSTGGPRPSTGAGLPSDEPAPPTGESTLPPGPGGSSDPGAGKTTIDEFIAKINAKDAAGATSMVCQGSESFSKDSISETTGGTPALKAGEYSGTALVTASIGGSVSGKDANGSVIASSFQGKWCIGGFFVIAF
ncbi:hypothetical protein [Amycolatopsis sp. PS_44_ISF1]|uniref:hypothetical protein n=1 Tax=Amycolatopsis sp. PS_44_ISF1 TaxID=2974917 RepID=UPI0028E035ED|nr:hypothetical protein [Amycolatopsis sp. PS_44_ISF1]MDT8910705.1 hypothetical protein [Amycolatopsis sp. PS_44_ISF1]